MELVEEFWGEGCSMWNVPTCRKTKVYYPKDINEAIALVTEHVTGNKYGFKPELDDLRSTITRIVSKPESEPESIYHGEGIAHDIYDLRCTISYRLRVLGKMNPCRRDITDHEP
jgi:hypothetical protein